MDGEVGVERGWYQDPLGRYQQRYHDGEAWTAHVMAGDGQAVDPLGADPGPPPPPAPDLRPPPPVVGPPVGAAVAKVAELPPDPDGEGKRKAMAYVMFGAAGLYLISMPMTWLAPIDELQGSDTSTVDGFGLPIALFGAACFVGLAVYGWQGMARSYAKRNVWALFGVIAVVTASFGAALSVDDSTIEDLGLQPAGRTVTQQGGGITITVQRRGGADATEENAKLVQRGTGADLAFVGALASIVPLAVLWSDYRRRRAAVVAIATGAAS